ncbi:MAG: class I ribonucleotide reductase maintenance protein YfaE [Arsenophonus sp.]|nr:MAG: class I ribonucleotide reductase maintenance protein YfaE [Arsenophonus sp.]
MKKHKIFVLYKKKIRILFYDKYHKSILDTFEKNNIYINFQCRQGFCGICRTYLKKGKIKYQNLPVAFINHDEILPCICQPVTDIFIIA